MITIIMIIIAMMIVIKAGWQGGLNSQDVVS